MMSARILSLIAVNVFAWLLIHLGLAALGTRLRPGWLNPSAAWFRGRKWERDGQFYERWLRIRDWKDAMPDGAAWFRSGFPKAALQRRDPVYLQRFVRETCRGELVHVAAAAGALLFFLWNPPWAGFVMLGYGVLANLPCILIQRYNRLRLTRVLRAGTARSPRGERT